MRRARSTSCAALRAAQPGGDAARRLDRHRPVGHQAVPRAAATLIYIGEVAELKRIERRRDGALCASAPAPRWRTPGARWSRAGRRCADVWLRFASLPIRNAGTLGGNVANGSPIGDCAPVLMALGAEARAAPAASACAALALDDFYLGYMKNRARSRASSSQAIDVPLPRPDARFRAYKISKRFDCDISAVCAALALALDGDGRVERGALRLRRHGGDAASARRRPRPRCSASPGTKPRAQAAMRALAADFKPLTDMRASAAYRMQVAQNLLRRFWLETRLEAPLAERSGVERCRRRA